MDKDKLKKFVGYAGLSILGGYLGVFLAWGILAGDWDWITLGFIFEFEPEHILIPILGGYLGGVITKKWWGAFLGGFILYGLFWFAMFLW